ncbi:hypothetical protein KFE25_001099 [Diacronema lutheri]|uniref:Secondary thiamine-phosphate synthase enzyme n=1 Tax=Diacronema lutheri TaxID=2081491 RepID=A0A8J6C9E1_DIALT|nr:hypothetical protein KFE25_001099 [Diacronema lutheri]
MAWLAVLAAGATGFASASSASRAAQRAVFRRAAPTMGFVSLYEELPVVTGRTISLRDITADVAAFVERSGCKEGVVTVLSKHSTVGITINEMEPRFVDDVRQFLLKLAPPQYPYLHNDLDYRAGPPEWPGGDEAWRSFRAGEPVNAHSHLIAMVMGTSESIPVHNGKLSIGKFQQVIVIDADGVLDGAGKKRTVALQVMGAA